MFDRLFTLSFLLLHPFATTMFVLAPRLVQGAGSCSPRPRRGDWVGGLAETTGTLLLLTVALCFKPATTFSVICGLRSLKDGSDSWLRRQRQGCDC